MDPNANILNQREIIDELTNKPFGHSEAEELELLRRLSELTEAMDVWLSKGGFLPKEWAREVTPDKVGAILGRVTSRCLDDDDDFAAVRDVLVEGLND